MHVTWSDLQVQLVQNVIRPQDTSHPVHNLHPDARLALGFEDVVDKVLPVKVDITPAVGVIFAERTLRIEAAKAPVNRRQVMRGAGEGKRQEGQ